MAIAVPGWPEFAFCTASIAKVRMVLTQISSIDFAGCCGVRREVAALPKEFRSIMVFFLSALMRSERKTVRLGSDGGPA